MAILVSNSSALGISEQIQIKEGWSSLKDYLRSLSPRIGMFSLGMQELYCSWLEIEDVLGSIEEGMSFTEGIMTAHYQTIKLIESKLRKGYSTHDLDVDVLMQTPGIRLIPTILELRKREVESAKVFFTKAGNRINVRDLKRTFYGKRLMRELQFTKYTRHVSQEDFQKLKDAMRKSGLKIKEPRKK